VSGNNIVTQNCLLLPTHFTSGFMPEFSSIVHMFIICTGAAIAGDEGTCPQYSGDMSPYIPTEGATCFMSPKKLNSQCMPLSGLTSSVQFNCKSSTQNVPKLAFLSSKIQKFSGREGAPPPHTYLLPSAPRSSRLQRLTLALVPPISNRNRCHCRPICIVQ